MRRTLAWALPALAILASSGALGLLEPTETRYAEIAREMAASRDFLTPRLNGIVHFHKPPVAYWAAAGGMGLLGQNEWGARLGVALAAAFVLWCTARIARSAGPETRAVRSARSLAPVLLGSSALFFALSHQLASDIFLAAAVAGFYAAFLDRSGRRPLLPFVALAVGFMVKGPVVFIHTVVPVLIAALWTQSGAPARRLASARGWSLFAVLALPWYLIVVARTPGLLSYFLGHQLWQRYATTIHQRAGPPHYFIAVALAGSLPWTAAAIAGVWKDAKAASRGHDFVGAVFVAWALWPLLFFTTSGSKLPAYVLPELPVVALAAARAVEERSRVAHWGAAIALLALAGLISIAGPHLLARGLGAVHAATLPLPPGVMLASLAFAAAGVACLFQRSGWGAAIALTAWLLVWIGVRPLEGPMGSPRPLARLLREVRAPGDPVVVYGRFNAGLPFYLGERVKLLEVPREVQFDDAADRARVMIRRADLPRLVTERGRIWVLAPERTANALAATVGLEAVLIARWKSSELAVLTPGERAPPG